MNYREYIFIYTSTEEYPMSAVSLATQLASKSNKPICFLSLEESFDTSRSAAGAPFPTLSEQELPSAELTLQQQCLQQWCDDLSKEVQKGVEWKLLSGSKGEFEEFMTESEASSLIFALSEHRGYDNVRTFLSLARGLRVPYFFVKPYFKEVDLSKLLCPVTMLIEDRQKGVYAHNLGNAFGSEIMMMVAKDYGSKAKGNANAIETLLDKYGVKWTTVEATKDSFKVEREAVRRAEEFGAGMVLVSASRSYGLDDILFGPKELRIINEANVPLLVINPRADLYVLCG